jgi:hypothetical protein
MSKYAGHTPGPWQVSHVGGTWRHSVHSEAKSICTTANTTAEDHDEDEANARLMADAPKLLAERDRLREALNQLIERTDIAEEYPYEVELAMVALQEAEDE